MKLGVIFLCAIVILLAGCDRILEGMGMGKGAKAVGSQTQTQEAGTKHPQILGTPMVWETSKMDGGAMPQDVGALTDQLARFDAAFQSGNIDAYEHAFDGNARFLDRYPIWTDLDCQVDVQRPNAIWCAYGRMGQPEDRELEGQLTFLANKDALTPGLRCSDVLCINQDGHPVGVIQPQMRQWIAKNCKRSPDLRLECS